MWVTLIFGLGTALRAIGERADAAFRFQSAKSRNAGRRILSIAAVRQRPIQIQFEVIGSQPKQIEIPLFDGQVVWAVQRETEGFTRYNADTFSWSGQIHGANGWRGDVVLTLHKDAMAGSITAPSGVYSILPQPGGAHVLIEIDRTLFPDSGDDTQIATGLIKSSAPADPVPPFAPAVDNGSLIDVLMVYSDDVRAFLGGTTQATAFAQQAIAVTNSAYQNSGITPRLRLVHTMELDYVESGNTGTDLNFIQNHAGVGDCSQYFPGGCGRISGRKCLQCLRHGVI